MLDVIEHGLWQAFQLLHLGRTSSGFGPNPISLSEIHSYMELFDMRSSNERQEFVTIIRALDAAYLAKVLKK